MDFLEAFAGHGQLTVEVRRARMTTGERIHKTDTELRPAVGARGARSAKGPSVAHHGRPETKGCAHRHTMHEIVHHWGPKG